MLFFTFFILQQWNHMKCKKNLVLQESVIGTGMCSRHVQQQEMAYIKDYNGLAPIIAHDAQL